jgi:tetratricopeptide (TPR) repeat protein
MRQVCLLMLVYACAGLAQEPTMTAMETQAAIDAEMRERFVLEGGTAARPLSPRAGPSPIDENHAILSALDLPTARFSNPETQLAGITSVKRLGHKVPKQALKAFERAAKLSKARKHGEAAQQLQQAITIDPDFAEAHTNLGAQFYLLNRPQEAEAVLLRSIELDPASASAYVNLAAVKLLLRDPDAAEQFAQRALALSPRSEAAHRILDKLYVKAP